MAGIARKLLTALGGKRFLLEQLYSRIFKNWFLQNISDHQTKQALFLTGDPARYGSILLALNRLKSEQIEGAIAELGVFHGNTSKVLHSLSPDRDLYLFDTFNGFPEQDLDGRKDHRFSGTSLDLVKKNIGNLDRVFFREGYFPATAVGLEDKIFAFVMLDADLYAPTLSGLEFFYPRLAPGGYLFLHDYNSPESDWAVSRAVTKFMQGKPELLIEIPDMRGSVIIRKLK